MFASLVEYTEGRDTFAGKRILEIGPGEELTLALRMLAAGARQVIAIDRFAFHTSSEWDQSVYRSLFDELSDDERDRLAGLLDEHGRLHPDPDRLQIHTGLSIEAAADLLESASFDLITSVAVLEHVYDLESALRSIDRLLRPGGRMLHQVDLRDHGMFTAGGGHPLRFLAIPNVLYRLMTSHTGAPNRERVGFYRESLQSWGYELRITPTCGVDPADERPPVPGVDGSHELINPIRGRLLPRFAAMSDEDLAIGGIFLDARKPTR